MENKKYIPSTRKKESNELFQYQIRLDKQVLLSYSRLDMAEQVFNAIAYSGYEYDKIWKLTLVDNSNGKILQKA